MGEAESAANLYPPACEDLTAERISGESVIYACFKEWENVYKLAIYSLDRGMWEKFLDARPNSLWLLLGFINTDW